MFPSNIVTINTRSRSKKADTRGQANKREEDSSVQDSTNISIDYNAPSETLESATRLQGEDQVQNSTEQRESMNKFALLPGASSTQPLNYQESADIKFLKSATTPLSVKYD